MSATELGIPNRPNIRGLDIRQELKDNSQCVEAAKHTRAVGLLVHWSRPSASDGVWFPEQQYPSRAEPVTHESALSHKAWWCQIAELTKLGFCS